MCNNLRKVVDAGTIGKNGKEYYDDVKVACGTCLPCRKRKLQQWSFRLMQEDKNSSQSLFVTLTYDNNTVPITKRGFMTLIKQDLQKYFKRLRKRSKDKIKYYAVGEYGSITKRPHYHIILFNATPEDAIAAWSLDEKLIGNVDIGRVSEASVAYVLKYVNKQQEYIPDWKDIEQPFKLGSTGLGKNYLTHAIQKYHKDDIERNYVQSGTHKVAMPRYYRDRIYDDQDKAEQAQWIQKLQREKIVELKKQIGDQDYDYYIRQKIQRDIEKKDDLSNRNKL